MKNDTLERLYNEEHIQIMLREFKNLDQVEAYVLIRHFGLMEKRRESDGVVAKTLGVPCRAIRSFRGKAITRLRQMMWRWPWGLNG